VIQDQQPAPVSPAETFPPPQRIQLPQTTPVVTYTLLGISIFVYLLQLGSQLIFDFDWPAAYGVKYNPLIEAGQFWRLLTPLLLHGSILHLAFNMYALYVLGRRIERFFGHYRFLALYTIGGFAGNILSMLFTSAASLGSSTAIFGLLGAEGVFIYQHRAILGERAKQALQQIIQVAVINLLIGLSPGIDNWGHVGGLLGGATFTWLAGPLLQIGGLPPFQRIEDARPPRTVSLVFGALTILLAALAGGIIYLRVKN